MFWEKRKNAGNDREGVNAGRGWSSPQSVFINISGWHCKKTDAYIFLKFGNILIQKNARLWQKRKIRLVQNIKPEGEKLEEKANLK